MEFLKGIITYIIAAILSILSGSLSYNDKRKENKKNNKPNGGALGTFILIIGAAILGIATAGIAQYRTNKSEEDRKNVLLIRDSLNLKATFWEIKRLYDKRQYNTR